MVTRVAVFSIQQAKQRKQSQGSDAAWVALLVHRLASCSAGEIYQGWISRKNIWVFVLVMVAEPCPAVFVILVHTTGGTRLVALCK